MIKLTVIGCGRWGKNILRTLSELETSLDFELNEVVHTGNPEREQWVHETLDVKCHSNLDSALVRNDAACIVTPDETHSELVDRCLREELDVFVEKPLAFDRTEALNRLDRAKNQDNVLMPGHLMLFHPVLETLEDNPSFKINQLDEILVTRRSNLRESGERRLIHSSLVHDIALLDHLFGHSPNTSVVHHAQGPFPPLCSLDARLTYDGIVVKVDARSDWPFPKRSIVFRTGKRFFKFDGIKDTLEIIDTSDKSIEPDVRSFNALPLTDELRQFVSLVQGGNDSRITPDHIGRVMQTMDTLEELANP
jgi:predicted dehydrogenase